MDQRVVARVDDPVDRLPDHLGLVAPEHRVRRRRFERRIGLPQGVDRERANAVFSNGVLTVTLPWTEPAKENVRRVPINGKAA
ncbi:MAG: Hsp20 family protein [Sphingopyxis sp.]|nr:Hsp20 family protein [Sphingopyxis sp.]